MPNPSGSRKSAAGADDRLDPARWHRPRRGTLLRLVAIAALLTTAAAVAWSSPSCSPLTGVAAVPSPASTAATPPNSSATGAVPPAPAGSAITAAGSLVPAGRVGVPVRLADPTALTVVHAGDHVDLLRLNDTAGNDTGGNAAGGNDTGGTATAVATAAQVLIVTGVDDPATGSLLLALTPAEARQAVVTPSRGFAILIRPD